MRPLALRPVGGRLLLALSLLGATAGCQLFGLDDREFEIQLPEIPIGPVQFKGSLMRLEHCPAPDLRGSMEGETISIAIAQGLATNLLDPQNGTAEIQEYADRINGVTISKITYKIGLNTMEKDLEAINILFGPYREDFDPTNIDLEEERDTHGAAVYGSTQVIERGTTTYNDLTKAVEFVPVLQNAEGQAEVRKHLSEFKFTTLFGTDLELTAQDCENLGGDLEIEARIGIVLFVEPL